MVTSHEVQAKAFHEGKFCSHRPKCVFLGQGDKCSLYGKELKAGSSCQPVRCQECLDAERAQK